MNYGKLMIVVEFQLMVCESEKGNGDILFSSDGKCSL